MRAVIISVLISAFTLLNFSCSQSGKPKKEIKGKQIPLANRANLLQEVHVAIKSSEVHNLNISTFSAKVIRILDGDTMEILYKNKPIKIRLAHIDCPEKRSSQPFNNEAKKALSDLCFGQQVTIYGENLDRYRRLIAVIVNDKKQTVNQEMIKRGMAWHFKKYSTNVTYANLELVAKKNRVGLWRDPNPVPPWAWRKSKHK